MIDATDLMRLAISKGREGIARGQTPFGCAIALNDDVLSVSHNLVRATTDITAHAEITAIRAACQRLGRIHLTGCIVATTCEPCPMCMSALHWARVEEVYYGAEISDATAIGFNELKMPAAELLKTGESHVRLISAFLRDECRALFDEWRARPDHLPY